MFGVTLEGFMSAYGFGVSLSLWVCVRGGGIKTVQMSLLGLSVCVECSSAGSGQRKGKRYPEGRRLFSVALFALPGFS